MYIVFGVSVSILCFNKGGLERSASRSLFQLRAQARCASAPHISQPSVLGNSVTFILVATCSVGRLNCNLLLVLPGFLNAVI
jgi:hypothetical protein